jgi:hypothetical protein
MKKEESKMKNGEEIIVVAAYETIVEANFARGLLKEGGIPSFLKDENMTQLYPMFNSPFGGIKLCIMRKDEEKAIEILKENKLIEN